jgi:hypothetical protein
MQSARKELGGMAKGVKNVAGVFRDLALVAAPVAAVGAAVFGLAKHAANVGDELLTMSKHTGLSVEQLSLLKFAAEQSDTNLQALGTGFKFLGKSMAGAQKAGSESATAFAAIGVESKNADGSLRPMHDVMLEVADAFKNLPDGATKSALAMRLFGISGVELIPLLSKGSAGIRELTDRAKELGLQITTDQAQAADQFNDQFNEMTRSAEALAIKVGNVLIPSITDLMVALTNLGTEGRRHEGLLVFFPWLKEIPAFADKTKDIPRVLMDMQTSFSKLSGASVEDQAKMKAALDAALATYKQAAERVVQLKLGAEERAKAEVKALSEIDKAQQRQSENFVHHLEVETAAAEKALQGYLELRLAYKQTDEDYFLRYRQLLEMQGLSSEQVQLRMAQHVQELKLTMTQTVDEMAVLWSTWFGEMSNTMAEFQSFSRDTWSFFSRSFGDAVGEVITQGGKLSTKLRQIFQQILAAFISMVTQMMVRWIAFQALTGGWGVPGGAVLGGAVNFPAAPRLAHGGIVTRPTLAVIGEEGPEAVIPLNGNASSLGTIRLVIDGNGELGRILANVLLPHHMKLLGEAGGAGGGFSIPIVRQ